MAGQHIEREARYAATGLTTEERDKQIRRLSTELKWSQRQIGRKLGMTQAGVSFALKRIRGEERNRAKMGVCDYCAEDAPKDDLIDGMCAGCRAYTERM